MANRQTGGRTFTMIYGGSRLTVAEGMDGTCELRIGKHRVPAQAKTFKAAVNEGKAWLLENAGKMDAQDYERSEA